MKTTNFGDDREAWLSARKGKITGTRLKDILVKRGNGKKIGYYELIAERCAIPADEENPMERGNRLEQEAIERFQTETGKTVDTSLVIWQRDDNDAIAISPDGFIGDTEAVEVKCLSSARHIEAYLTKEIPSELKDQVIQYFIVNDALEAVHSVFYDPRFPSKDYFCFTTKREDVATQVEEYLAFERDTLAEIDRIVLDLTF